MPAVSDGVLHVLLGERAVGRLAQTREGLVAFQYESSWLEEGFSINPYSLPLEDMLFVPNWDPFGGLFGAFHDSLPDGWGALLLDRVLRSQGTDPSSVGLLERLAIVGASGRGALSYEPSEDFVRETIPNDLDTLAAICADILADRAVEDLDAAYAAGGSSGGARPKAYVEVDGQAWLVKFPSRFDPKEAGALEFDYMNAAAECGIDVPEYQLFPSKLCSGYFGTKRFDIKDEKRIHMLSASGLLEVSHRLPSLDYENLFQLSFFLTGSSTEAEQLFRRMCFNVFAHNHDDHSNNFSWLCEEGRWHLSPAYDLTYSETAYHQHSTSVLGVGKPGMDDVLALAKEIGLSAHTARSIASEIYERCHDLLTEHGLATK